jgi:hypothetical protein
MSIYNCPYCAKIFSRNYNCKRHIQSVHYQQKNKTEKIIVIDDNINNSSSNNNNSNNSNVLNKLKEIEQLNVKELITQYSLLNICSYTKKIDKHLTHIILTKLLLILNYKDLQICQDIVFNILIQNGELSVFLLIEQPIHELSENINHIIKI